MAFSKLFTKKTWLDKKVGRSTPINAAALNAKEEMLDAMDSRLTGVKNGVLNSIEEIEANTLKENIAGALAFKEFLNVMGNVSGVAKIIAPAPTGVNSYQKIASYPEGYSKDNCYIITANITNGGEYIVNSGYSFFPALGVDGIYGFVSGEFWMQQTVGILLFKY